MVNEKHLNNAFPLVVPIVEVAWEQVEAAKESTVPIDAKRPQAEPEPTTKRFSVTAASSVTVTSSIGRRNRRKPPTVKTCDICGEVYLTVRPKKARFCSHNCKQKSWLLSNPERAAEVAKADKERLKQHLISRGHGWVEQGAE